ncbi:hypothetical protein J31TS4_40130 [Paenibacillus sp. J31TS4]|uniref:Cthe_2314 family HEPN domain-containing protein n=1 Tax=Paenibacillus sp. J31TS4 TaxID=2807195 RepID=UPI001B1C48CB|nr:Cthe_2314 family HEPN domain-containing protein [Paenibacillus sp. J31TS4]GIP40733.1 hypothetical protein J31TS4_40130 [Paenibacillus sp. J31TS4]
MLRFLFDEPRRKEEGLLGEAMEAIAYYFNSLDPMENHAPKQGNHRHVRYLQIWINGFIRALDELEQSAYCAKRYAERLSSRYLEKMDLPERDDYHRHLYFYKNGFLRVFSILDKLGFFFNELLQLETERFKAKFSYFTVLRQMHEKKIEAKLEEQLFQIKNDFQDSLTVLRNQRNMETHSMNTEIMDDLEYAKRIADACTPIEDVQDNIRHLDRGFEMVCRTLITTFRYLHEEQPASVEEQAVERTAEAAEEDAASVSAGKPGNGGKRQNGNHAGPGGQSGEKPGGRLRSGTKTKADPRKPRQTSQDKQGGNGADGRRRSPQGGSSSAFKSGKPGRKQPKQAGR